MEVVGINDRCDPYLVPHHVTLVKHVVVSRWRSDSQGFVPVFSEDLVVGLQSKPFRKNVKIKLQGEWKWEKCEDAVETISRPTLTCQGNLCPRQLRCPARGCPSQKACFHCEETETHCVRRTPTRQSKTNNLLWHGRSSAPDLLNYNQLENSDERRPPPPCVTNGLNFFLWSIREKNNPETDSWMDFVITLADNFARTEKCTTVKDWVTSCPF